MPSKPTSIDEYLDRLDRPGQAALRRLRKIIRSAAPAAEECISYQLCAFRQDGMLVAFGATPNHCALYAMSSTALQAFDLSKYRTGKGTIRFAPDQPLPAALVRKIVKTRLAENASRKRP